MSPIARYLLLLISAGIVIAAALGLAGAAYAASTDVNQPSIVATPNVKAHPAPNAMPGWRWHHGVHHLQDLQPGYAR
ncbi:MAG: hypothetical protein QOF15_2531 [Mycobacterium sp.]|jgi:hypothetical protein|nr:hypothetical protein [Mycobacterium sp.]